MPTAVPQPPLTPPMTISRDLNGRRFYIAVKGDGRLGGTFDRSEAIAFRTFQESRAWIEKLDLVWVWALFVAGDYRLDFRARSDRPVGPFSAGGPARRPASGRRCRIDREPATTASRRPAAPIEGRHLAGEPRGMGR